MVQFIKFFKIYFQTGQVFFYSYHDFSNIILNFYNLCGSNDYEKSFYGENTANTADTAYKID